MFLDWFRKPQTSRKYVDLLNETSSKWANWDPPVPINAGDFGTINPRSGLFECDGNIYKHPDVAAIARGYETQQTPEEDMVVIHSHHARQLQQMVNANVHAGPAAEAGVSLQIQFEEERGAFLIMHRDKQIVTEAFSCHGYVQYLSNGSKHAVAVALNGDVLAAMSSPASVNLGGAWRTEGGQGFFCQGYHTGGAFAPLFALRKLAIPKRRRYGSPGSRTDQEEWMDASIPWSDLDEDGLAPGEEFEEEEDETSRDQQQQTSSEPRS